MNRKIIGNLNGNWKGGDDSRVYGEYNELEWLQARLDIAHSFIFQDKFLHMIRRGKEMEAEVIQLAQKIVADAPFDTLETQPVGTQTDAAYGQMDTGTYGIVKRVTVCKSFSERWGTNAADYQEKFHTGNVEFK